MLEVGQLVWVLREGVGDLPGGEAVPSAVAVVQGSGVTRGG